MSTRTITLDPSIEQHVKELAERNNVSVDEYVNDIIKKQLSQQSGAVAPGTMSGAEMLAYWERVGAFSDTPLAENSVDIVNRMREQMKDRWKT